VASGAVIAANEPTFGTETLEISTATAGAVTDRNSRTAAPVDALGEPVKSCAN
jgi:hypothetical protein